MPISQQSERLRLVGDPDVLAELGVVVGRGVPAFRARTDWTRAASFRAGLKEGGGVVKPVRHTYRLERS
jgi:hypothetical protein